ncbi:MAG: hypothetical protein CMK56_07635 [Proteobacteria bacterium]|nr:hypothetical protein [Pseudomonadota bacterium]
MESAERKLAAILAMDVVDYSAKMSQDEQVTLRSLKECRKIIENVVSSQKGRVFNTAGDAFMIEFASPVTAVDSAIKIQKQIRERNNQLAENEHLEFRMGLNMGDIMIEGENLFGEGVNIASRLEGVAPVGGICVSEMVYSMTKGKVDVNFIDQGQKNLKNIDEPVRAFFVEQGTGEKSKSKKRSRANTKFNINWAIAGAIGVGAIVFALINNQQVPREENSAPAELNTLVVIPLENLGTDSSINFANGISSDLANGLSRAAKSMNVINLGKRPEKLEEITDKTGASYIISGNVRQAGDAIRLSVNLLDASNLSTVWTETYDKSMTASNIFELQDEIVKGVINELVGNGAILARDIAKEIEKKGTDNLSAYECVTYVTQVHHNTWSPETHNQALECLRAAVVSDPSYSDAWTYLSHEIAWGYSLFGTFTKESLNEGIQAADNALRLDPESGMAYAHKAKILFFQQDWQAMYEAGEKAVRLAPANSEVLGNVGQIMLWAGDCSIEELTDFDAKPETYASGRCGWQTAFQHLIKAYKLDTTNNFPYENYALHDYYTIRGEYSSALQAMERTAAPGFFWWDLKVGIAHAGMGNKDKADAHFNAAFEASSNKLSDWEKEYQFFNASNFFEIYKPTLIENGLE